MDIADIVCDLVEKYNTRSPYLLANYEGITVLYRSYVMTFGYYIPRHIVLDCDMHRICQTVVCAHELGHGIIHPDALSYLDIGDTEKITEIELTATDFARHLLFPDDPRMTTRHMIEYMQFVIRSPWK